MSDKFIDIQFAGGQQLKETVETSNLTLNILGQIKLPVKFINFYSLFGFNANHLLSVDDWDLVFQNNKRNDFHDFIFDEYTFIVCAGIVGAGIEINEIIYMEYRYNFPFMSSTKGEIKVKDSYSGFAFGVYLNKIFEKK